MEAEYRTLTSVIEDFVTNYNVKPIYKEQILEMGHVVHQGINVNLELTESQYQNLLNFGYSGEKYNVYYTLKSDNNVFLSAPTTDDIDNLLGFITQ